MRLDLFRSLWGHAGQDRSALARRARADGYQGLECRLPEDAAAFRNLLDGEGLDYIATGFTGGDVLPDWQAGVDAHLESFRRKLDKAVEVRPRFLNFLAGNDRWGLAQQVAFFGAALEIAEASGVTVLFESHRGRSFYSPWVTLQVIEQLPELRFTSDISHWVLVCERLLDREAELLAPFTERVLHVQARVGYDQGPQVPHPAAPEYAGALAFHAAHWRAVWRAQAARGMAATSVTPEFGPDGYLHHLPFTDVPVADLAGLNNWMGDWVREDFSSFSLEGC